MTYAVNVLKNMRWPGAVAAAKNGKYCNIYVGDGIKRGGDPCYNPTQPPNVQSDFKEPVEKPEPTPLHAPADPVEPNTEDNKEDEKSD